jgi:hypothetical protein
MIGLLQASNANAQSSYPARRWESQARILDDMPKTDGTVSMLARNLRNKQQHGSLGYGKARQSPNNRARSRCRSLRFRVRSKIVAFGRP